ncbi:efflux RND transporter periplasmic adaptor subunit [Actinophytocola oryzae]|uniref:Multidrug efflux pump subunit AcrA (Membrane-fusion protein) n=1 Tax=Actinophytocola oryzae TaxID=502181 RepID=A0A4V3FQD3_9PSEU|nr:peptidoglycan-binding protein [Actinophytocola oryzae]TDV37760.1 multidrug efflux pump subunit AcrA (membrane-fusion protein) [Actinophytocola oryzae]
MNTRLLIPLVVFAAAAVTLGAVLLSGGNGTPPVKASATAKAKTTDLTRTETFDGVVAYKDMRGLSTPKPGVITWLPAVGTDLKSGEVLLSVDAQPVVLLAGVTPAWRNLEAGVPDGPDVLQLETALAALGHGGTPDSRWDEHTTEAVKALQTGIGATADGVLSLGEVVFTPTDVHIAKVDGHVGATVDPDASVLTVQSTDRVVLLEVDPLKRDLVAQGAQVNVELPAGTVAHGTITAVSTTLTQNADGKSIYQITVELTDPDQVKDLALAPVTVHYVATVATQVLAVPVSSIIGVPGGGYAVTTVTENGATRRVPVTLGAWGDGYVQVTGNLRAGDTVEVPT